MEILGCHSRKENIKTEARGVCRLHDQIAILGAQAHLSASTKTNLLSQTTRDPHTKAVSPLLDPRPHATSRLYGEYTRYGLQPPRLHLFNAPDQKRAMPC
jgi:hypothetical protein